MNPYAGEPSEVDSDHRTPPDTERHRENIAFVPHKKINEPSNSNHDPSEVHITNPDLWASLKVKLDHYPYHITYIADLVSHFYLLMKPWSFSLASWSWKVRKDWRIRTIQSHQNI